MHANNQIKNNTLPPLRQSFGSAFFYIFCVLALLLPGTGFAGVGILPIGFGSQSYARSGTDIAYSSDPMSLNNNPAGIAQIDRPELNLIIEPNIIYGVRHQDSLGNNKNSDNDLVVLVSGGWATPLASNPDIVVGLGLFTQGGVGYDYPDLKTDFDNRDDLLALFGVFRLAPAIAWNINERLRVGLSASINYSQAEQEVFPDTSVLATEPFFGLKLNDLSGTSLSWRIGLQYDLNDQLTVGFNYSEQTDLKLDGGNAEVNYSALGIGKIDYQNARITGLSLPREIGIGFAWQATPKLSIGADLNWYEWSESLGNIRSELANPNYTAAEDGPPIPDQITVITDFGGQDNFSKSVSADYLINERNQLFLGLQHTSNVITKAATSPLTNLLGKWHLSIGLEHQFTSNWHATVVYAHALQEQRDYQNTQFPLGNESRESYSAYNLVFEVGYRW
jgi:long-chain fatty acid transport protein